ncbi:MAG TPA: hypothetical protein VK616_06035 [Flavitalea sp.]|nr:hypothetical protein [Flavitalea sp.]
MHIIEPRIKGNAEIAAVLDPVASNCSNNQITMYAGIKARTKKDGFWVSQEELFDFITMWFENRRFFKPWSGTFALRRER